VGDPVGSRQPEVLPLDVRRMRAVDAPAVSALCSQLGYRAREDEIAQRLSILDSESAHAMFVATIDADVVGWIHVYGITPLEAGTRAEIGGLVVASHVRRRGVGRALILAAEEWATNRDYPRVRIRSNGQRENAHRFYESLGYETTKTSIVFEKILVGDEGRARDSEASILGCSDQLPAVGADRKFGV
jgi:GNAT superfamily N-acetyltransferase